MEISGKEQEIFWDRLGFEYFESFSKYQKSFAFFFFAHRQPVLLGFEGKNSSLFNPNGNQDCTRAEVRLMLFCVKGHELFQIWLKAKLKLSVIIVTPQQQ